MQSKLESSTTPKFMFEDSKIMDENVSAESSSPEELLQVWMTGIYRIFVMEYYFIINSEAYICIFSDSKRYNIWELAAKTKLFHLSGIICICLPFWFICKQYKLMNNLLLQNSNREKPRSTYSFDWNGANLVLK